MRSKFITTTIAAALALLFLASDTVAQTKVGTVDVQRVRKENPEFKAALAEIDDMVGEFERRRDQKQLELQQLGEEMQSAQDRNIPASADRVRSTLQTKSQEFQAFMEESFGEAGIIETKSAELLEPVYTKLAEAAKSVAKAQSLDLILDTEQVNPLYVSDALDITDDVLAEMARLR